MSTTKKPLKYLWSGIFANGKVIDQPADDRYSKHVEGAEWNPSAFRDLQDYQGICNLHIFQLNGEDQRHSVDLRSGQFTVNRQHFFMDDNDINSERKLIFYRVVQHHNNDGVWEEDPIVVGYKFGYEYKNSKGRNVEKVIIIDG